MWASLAQGAAAWRQPLIAYFSTAIMIHVTVTLCSLQAWFRELPSGILDAVSPPEMAAVNGEEAALALLPKLPPVQGALVDWVLNLMADVVDNEAANRMNSRNIAMVFAPNLSQVWLRNPSLAALWALACCGLLLLVNAWRAWLPGSTHACQ